MKKLFLCAVLILCVGVSQAAVINIDMNNGDEATFSCQGAYADASNDFWNGALAGEATGLIESDGATATGVAITTSAGRSHRWNTDLGMEMLGDYNYTRDDVSTIDITGLAASSAYGIYVYLGGDNDGQITTVTLDGRTVTQTFAYQGTDYRYGPEGNWMYIWADTDVSGAISGSFTAAAGRYGALRGLQIVEVTEPATMALLGLGGLLLRKRKK